MKSKTIIQVMAICMAGVIAGSLQAKTIIASGKTEKKQMAVGSFSGIINKSIADVEYHQSAKSKVVIIAPENIIPHIQLVVSKGELVVKHKDNSNFRLKDRDVTVMVWGPNVKRLQVDGTGDIEVMGNMTAGDLVLGVKGTGSIESDFGITAKTLSVVVTGTGDVSLQKADVKKLQCGSNGTGDVDIDRLKATTVEVGITGTGSVDLNGTAASATYAVSGTGEIDADEMKVNKVEASVAGTGSVKCFVTEELTGVSTGTGRVTYYGNPKKVNAGKGVHKGR